VKPFERGRRGRGIDDRELSDGTALNQPFPTVRGCMEFEYNGEGGGDSGEKKANSILEQQRTSQRKETRVQVFG